MRGHIPADEDAWLYHKWKPEIDVDSLPQATLPPGPIEDEVDTYQALALVGRVIMILFGPAALHTALDDFSLALASECTATFLVVGLALRYVVLPRLLAVLCSRIDPTRIPFVRPPKGASALERWWVLEGDMAAAPSVATAPVADIDSFAAEAEARGWVHGTAPLRQSVAECVLADVCAARACATADFYAQKRKGLKEAAGEPPMWRSVAGWRGLWAEMGDPNAQLRVTGQLVLLLWHVLTVCLGAAAVAGRPAYGRLACHLTWAANCGDLLVTLFSPRTNFHGARRLDQLLLHHCLSLALIPAFFLWDMGAAFIFHFLLVAEVSGGLTVLLGLLAQSPLHGTPTYWRLHAAVVVELLYHRCIVWGALSYAGTRHVHATHGPAAAVAFLCLALPFLWFNRFMVVSWWRRLDALPQGGLHRLAPTKTLEVPLSVLAGAFQGPCTGVALFAVPVLHAHIAADHPVLALAASAVSVGAVALAHASATPGPRPRRGAGGRQEFASFRICKALLSKAELSPAPHRYRHPRPAMVPFAEWVRAMLLYNDRGHLRLKHSYPRLAHAAHVRDYDALITDAVDRLLREATAGGTAHDFDLMYVCTRLPWHVMQHITGMPPGDQPRAAALVRVMGDFVGRPFDAGCMREAAVAQREMVCMIRRWAAAWQSAGGAAGGESEADGVFPRWLRRRTFPNADEFEANVVMLLFAGTHNLENVLGHAVRLLLQHPDQLQRLRADPTLLDNAVEEVLRYCPAIRVVPRIALSDVAIPESGVAIREGETVLLRIAEANRDPAVHERPAEFDVARATAHRHLTFGAGQHLCNGNALARLQIKRLLQATVLGPMGHAKLVQKYGEDWVHTYAHLEELRLQV